MTPAELKERTKRFALDIIELVKELPKDFVSVTLGRQLLDAGTSVGANYRASCRSRSRAEFVSRMSVVEEEADESGYWLDLLASAGIVTRPRVATLIDEASQLVAIAAASGKTARGHSR